jgi:sodium transport system ATP-binding protein
MVQCIDLRKSFPTPSGEEKDAVHELNLSIGPGHVYGLLGPNGAGKTTTLRILAGLVSPTAGTAILNGHDVRHHTTEAKAAIGYMPSNAGLYHRLSPKEVLTYFGRLLSMESSALYDRVDALITWLDMSDFAHLRCGALSTGQRQRTNIARALMGDPPILIMDEPTLGLDVLTNRIILDFILQQRDAGKTILLSTHYLDEAETLCDCIGLLHHGRLIAEGDMPALRQQTGLDRLTDIFLSLIGETSTDLPARPHEN